MKLYHGSPKLIDELKPQQANGRTDYENQEAIFLTTEFLRAALYAIGKTLKGTTAFGVKRKKLIILGDYLPSDGYVYEFEISENKLVKGLNTDEYAIKNSIKPLRMHNIHSKDYAQYIVHTYVKTKDDFFKALDKGEY